MMDVVLNLLITDDEIFQYHRDSDEDIEIIIEIKPPEYEGI